MKGKVPGARRYWRTLNAPQQLEHFCGAITSEDIRSVFCSSTYISSISQEIFGFLVLPHHSFLNTSFCRA